MPAVTACHAYRSLTDTRDEPTATLRLALLIVVRSLGLAAAASGFKERPIDQRFRAPRSV